MPPKAKFSSPEQTKLANALRSAFEAGRIGPNVEELLDSVQGPGWKERRAYNKLPFETVVEHLRAYGAEFGHTAVPADYRTVDGFALGRWVLNVRTGRNGTGFRRLPDHEVAVLEGLPGWSWDRRVVRSDEARLITA
ncbi:helicase associated domain-containing protein [Curtobacterium sp. MCSS17_016]|uniref:helicase associated domain-containing protein n=1 Tax=Curtobacterium sp. MCSS17_016 TaxID=2175644 RepID=UPI0015E87F6A|nr:helicase associated domain-containing protein [Curtobacterium sp. MCSS17_016]WIE80861.1 helicase associated domain-containing protein [Curtobacterium sp. MCSS17_016]